MWSQEQLTHDWPANHVLRTIHQEQFSFRTGDFQALSNNRKLDSDPVSRSRSNLLTLDLNIDNTVHQFRRQSVEQDNVVDSVQELGRELRLDNRHDRVTCVRAVRALRQRRQRLSTQIGRHNNERVSEVNLAALTVRQPTFVQHLQQNVWHLSF